MRGSRRGAALALLIPLLLGAGAGPDSPVADAAMAGDTEAVRELLRSGADVNAAQGDGMTALHWAARRGDVELADMLLFAGANVEAVTRIGQYTPLHLGARAGNAQLVTRLLEEGADPAAVTSKSGATALHLAASSGDVTAITALLDHGADPDAREAEWGQTPLTFAAAANRAAAIRVLLERGADPGLTSDVIDLQEMQRLDRLAQTRQNEVLKAFRGDDERAATSAELQAAVAAGREIYLDPPPPPDEDDEEEEDEEDDFQALFGPPIQKTGGLTPLLHAVRQGHLEAAVALLDGGADIDQVSAADGTSPLLMAAINGQFDLAAVLVERGADPNIASSLNGVTPLWATVNSEWQPRTRFPQPQQHGLQTISYLELMTVLLDAGADPDARLTQHPWYMVYTGCGNRNCGLVDTNGSTAFWRAAYATDVAAMKLLVSYGADPDIATLAPPQRQRLSTDEFLRRQAHNRLTEADFSETADSVKLRLVAGLRDELPDSLQVAYPDAYIAADPDAVRGEVLAMYELADSLRAAKPDPSGLPPVPAGGPAVAPIHAAAGAGYGEGFAGTAHRHAPDAWMTAVRYLIEELGADVNLRDHNGYTPMHHAAARGDNEMIEYLVSIGGDVTVVSRRGQTTADMANGPVQRVSPHPETVALLESLGSKNNHNCMSC
ncbi:MAG: ankyrin repeat domain-containing protein [Gemmatimonadota bacterium]|nr:ankyrin repeat domain-containing protein [Gemmatimonadota bacterium]